LHLASSAKLVGRVDFVLRILVATAMAVELERLMPLQRVVAIYDYSSRWKVPAYVGGYPIIAVFVMGTIVGRLKDARLSALYVFPIFLAWIFSNVTFMFGMHCWPIGLAFFVLVLIAGGFLPINPTPIKIGFQHTDAEGVGEEPLPESTSQGPLLDTGTPDDTEEKSVV
jgi:uncharacterized membrane protein YhaH (DUF805 family)